MRRQLSKLSEKQVNEKGLESSVFKHRNGREGVVERGRGEAFAGSLWKVENQQGHSIWAERTNLTAASVLQRLQQCVDAGH